MCLLALHLIPTEAESLRALWPETDSEVGRVEHRGTTVRSGEEQRTEQQDVRSGLLLAASPRPGPLGHTTHTLWDP